MKWENCRLKQISDYWTGKIDSSVLDETNYVSTDNLIPDKAGIVNSNYVPKSGRANSFQERDVLISNIRPYFKKIWFANKEGGCSNDVLVFRAKGNVEPLFLYYQLSKDAFFDYMVAGSNGTKMPRGNKTSIMEYQLSIPPLPTQRKIASILSAYDDLIENNLKRIKLLEEKARIEFKSIQKNERLEFKKSVDVLQFTTGKLNSNAAVPNGQYPFFTCGQEILRTNTFSQDEEVVLLGGNNASAIYPVFYHKGKFDAYQRTYIIKPKPEAQISFKYLYFFWESKLDYLKNISTGAATKFLTLKILNDIDVPLPNRKIMEEYEILTEPIFKLKAILAEQNSKLREARDILLPRLMSGQIEV